MRLRESRLRGAPRRFVAIAAIAFSVLSCRSSQVGGVPFPPLTAATPDEAARALADLRASFRGARSSMRVRTTRGGRSESFRAQLEVGAGDAMRLTIFSPLGTTAATLTVKGDRARTTDARGSRWEGSVAELSESYGFFAVGVLPADLARLVIGIPPAGVAEEAYDITSAGLRSARIGDATVAFDPAVFPPTHVVIRRGGDTAEIDHLEIVAAGVRL